LKKIISQKSKFVVFNFLRLGIGELFPKKYILCVMSGIILSFITDFFLLVRACFCLLGNTNPDETLLIFLSQLIRCRRFPLRKHPSPRGWLVSNHFLPTKKDQLSFSVTVSTL
jgi:hypothetical protein